MTNLEHDILAYFKSGKTLTVIGCLQRFHTSELRQYVSRINGRRKYFIDGTWEKKFAKRYKRFWLAASTHSAR